MGSVAILEHGQVSLVRGAACENTTNTTVYTLEGGREGQSCEGGSERQGNYEM